MLKRTPVLAVVLGGMIALVLALVVEEPGRPFAFWQQAALFLLSLLPGLGIAMLFDPFPRRKKEEYLKINFYEEGK